jgi:hypothetical protein
VIVVHRALLRRLRLLIACLVLSVVATPGGGALETQRPVAVLASTTSGRSADVASRRAELVADAGTRELPNVFAMTTLKPARLETASPTAFVHPAPRIPLYLVQQRFLL